MRIRLIFFILLFGHGYSYAQHWQSFGTPNSIGDPRCMFVDSEANILYTGGGFITINGQVIRGIGKWDGSSWQDLDIGTDIGLGTPNNVLAITKFQGQIIAAGAFSTVGGVNSPSIARWDGTSWHSFNGQPNGAVDDLLVYNNKLYVCGTFDSLGTIRANGIGMWDGANWHDVGNFPDYGAELFDGNVIYSIQFYENNLYLSGYMMDSTHAFDHFLAWFDGIDWHYFDDDLKGNLAFGSDLEVYNNELYVAGYFFTADGNYDNCIQRWNGTSWNSVGGGVGGINSTIWKLKAHNGKLYAVGAFTEAGGIPASKVAYWDDIKWCSLGSTFNGDIEALDFYRDTLHVGGGFKIVDGDSMIYLAKWLGGDYVDTCSFSVGISEINQSDLDFSIYPNPATSEIEITLPGNYQSQQLKIINTLGQVIKQQESSFTQISIAVSDLPVGVYFIELQNEKGRVVKKFLKN